MISNLTLPINDYGTCHKKDNEENIIGRLSSMENSVVENLLQPLSLLKDGNNDTSSLRFCFLVING